jgi:hypothetical protein
MFPNVEMTIAKLVKIEILTKKNNFLDLYLGILVSRFRKNILFHYLV